MDSAVRSSKLEQIMNTAQQIKDAANNSTDAMEQAEAAGAQADQDWDAETTTFTFADGSKLVVSGPSFTAA